MSDVEKGPRNRVIEMQRNAECLPGNSKGIKLVRHPSFTECGAAKE